MKNHGSSCGPLALLLVVSLAGTAHAQSGGIYDMRWNKVASGGTTTSAGGVYTLGGTIAQHDATASSGGAYTLAGGFWLGVASGQLVDVPDTPETPDASAVLALGGFVENPVRLSRMQVRFSLASGAPALLELLDVTGRRVASSPVGELGAGPHVFDLSPRYAMSPGLYWLRLTQGGRSLVRKAAVLE